MSGAYRLTRGRDFREGFGRLGGSLGLHTPELANKVSTDVKCAPWIFLSGELLGFPTFTRH